MAVLISRLLAFRANARPVGHIISWGKWRLFDLRTLAAFGLPFLLYIVTLAPTIYNLDSAELTTAAATAGLTRATGYPLYLLLGHVWSWLPVGDVGYRMNLLSATCGALTVALAERILRRLRVGPWASFGALGLLACTTYFWALSLIAEVYTLHTALMAALILALLRWAELPTPRRLALVGLIGGLSLTHHAATVLLIPGAVWYVLTVAPGRALAPRALLVSLAALLVGLSVYLYLPLRYLAQPAFNYAGHFDATGTFVAVDLRTPAGLWWLISGRAFAGQMLSYRPSELGGELGHFAAHLWRALFGFGAGPALLGLALTLRRDWRLGVMLLLMFVCSAAFYVDYRVIDKDTMFLPTYLICAIWIGVGCEWLLGWVRDSGSAAAARWSEWALRGLIIGGVLVAVAWNWRVVDLSHDWSTRVRGVAMLEVARPGALIFGWWDTVPPLQYLQMVEGQRRDVMLINRFLISPDDMRQLAAREARHRPVYIDNPTPELQAQFLVRPIGPLYQLLPR
jgi:hypothetical protein